jgi:hypothetical protein
MATVTWLIGALRSHTGQSLARDAYFGPILAPVRIWEEAVLGGPRVPTTGAISTAAVYGTV